MGNGVPINPADGNRDPCGMEAVDPPATLAASARRLLLALDGARADAYEWDFAHDRVCCVGTLSRELGFPPEEGTAAYLERVHPDDRDRLSLALAQLSADSAQYTLEYRVRDGSGAYIQLVDSGRAHFEVTGRRSCLLGVRRRVADDLTGSAAAALESGEHYRMLLQAVPSIAFEGDTDSGNMFASEQWCAYTGLTPEQTAGFGWTQAVHPDDLPGAAAFWAQAVRDGNPIEMRHRIRGADGSYRWFLLQAKPLRDGHGRIDRWVGSLTNIDELQRTEEALRESERRLTADLDAMGRLQKLGMQVVGDGNLEPFLGEIVDAAMNVSDADFGTIQILDPESLDLQIVAQRGFPAWWTEFWKTDSRREGASGTAVDRGERVIVEDIEQSPIFGDTPALEIQRRVGVRAVQSTPLISRSGKVVGMFSTHYRVPRRPDERALRLLDLLARQAADIIEQAQAEADLRESEERLRFALETSHIGAWELDLADHHSARRSLEHDRIFGYGELLPRWTYDMFLDHVLSQDRAAVDAKFREATATGSDWSFECRIRRVDGEVRWIWAAGRHRRDSTGNPRWMAGIVQDITERKQAEQALRESEQRLAGIVNAAMDAVISVDEQQRICLFNPAAEQVFGLSAAEALGQPLARLIPEGFPTAHVTHIRNFAQRGMTARRTGALREITGLRANGKEFPVEASVSQSWIAGGRLLTAILRDITQRKQAENALRQSQRLLHLFIEHAPAAIAMFDRHMRYLAASARWRADYHLGPELIGRSHYEVFFPGIPERWKEVHRRALAGEVLRAEDDCFERADGTVQWLIWEVRPWLTTIGDVGGILVFTEDITDIKRAEQALRESEERFQLASEIGRSGTWDWNVRTGEVIWSRGHYEILDYRVGGITPSYAAWADRVHAEDLTGVEEEIRRSMANHADYAAEFRVVWPDGSIRWMSARARYEYGDDGVCRRMVGIMADVTELKEAERQLQDMNTRLTALLAERTRLADERALHLRELAAQLTHAEQSERARLYELLHDHVQPLLVGARLSLSGLDERTSTDTWLRIAAEARKHITEALDTARSLGVELNPPVVREQGLGPALEWLCHWARTRHRLQVDLEWDATAEPADTATRMLLFKATRELLMNVAKHAAVNQVTLAMERTARPAVQITVSDRGTGFDTAACGEPWGPHNGSGLWSIERRLGMIGGRIEVDSAPGAGTTVRLSAPLRL